MFFVGCDSNVNKEDKKIIERGNLIKMVNDIEPDSLRGVTLKWRSKDLLVFRYNNRIDSLESDFQTPLFLSRTSDRRLSFKSGNNWIVIDSVTNHFGLDTMDLSSDRILYCYNLMEDKRIQSVFSYKGRGTFNIELDETDVFYTTDSLFFKEQLIYVDVDRLVDNWWVRVDSAPSP